jgi:anti-sigma regulatory factor (Ser/Thr protein kinase)
MRQASAEALPARNGSDRRERPAPGYFAVPPRPPGTLHTSGGHGRYASAELDPHPAAAGRARQLTRQALARWDMTALTDDAEAIAAELTANALAAVPPGTPGLAIVYALHATQAELRIYTWDIGPGHPHPASLDADAETGRGLTIIDALTCGNWGWWPTPESGGKVVHAALTAPAPGTSEAAP